MSDNEKRLQCPSLFNAIQNLKSTIESDLFSDELGSHEALHLFLRELCNEKTDPLIKLAIENTFGDPSLQQRIESSWHLSRDHHDAKVRQHMMDHDTVYDLASWCTKYCHSCFNGLLDYGMVRPSPYLFWLALSSGKLDLAQRLLSLIDTEELLIPFSTGIPNGVQYTMFQVATWKQDLFQTCWMRLKPLANNGLASLGPDEKRNIYQLANAELVDELWKEGLDLGNLDPGNESLGWLEMMSLEDPLPMLKLHFGRGRHPPKNLLTDAARHNYIHAARWLIDHGNYSQDWREAALVAAKSPDHRSVEMMAMILQDSATELAKDPKLSQNLVITIVEGACQQSQKYYTSGRISEKIEDMEYVAVRKIEALGNVVGKIEVLGTKIMAKNARLDGLSHALESMDLDSRPAGVVTREDL